MGAGHNTIADTWYAILTEGAIAGGGDGGGG